ncbi:MAG: glycosyl transferase, family 2 [Deltaproteobacteria bacterium]|nr:glycosyl transferase, family 2 [Deltaproteobacteria bacterium]
MKLSVVIPVFNEAARIVPTLEGVFAYMDRHHPGYDVLVVDDGSTDNTVALVQERFGQRPELQVVSYAGNRGKGYAVRFGCVHATGDVVLMTDADLSTPIDELEKMLPLLDQGYDLVIGSRALAQSEIRQRQPFYREGGGKLFNLLVRLVVLPDFHDTQCGFKLFQRNALLPVLRQQQIDGFAFDVEMIALAVGHGLRVAEVPVVWINSPTSRVRLWAALRAFADLVQIRRHARHTGQGVGA